MNEKLLRVGTTYIPVNDVDASAEWYQQYLGASLNYKDAEKAIIDLANQSFFLVKAQENQSTNFIDSKGNQRFSLTFEVNGLNALQDLHRELSQSGLNVGDIEDRGHIGKNFIFQDLNGNRFDVWSELSTDFKERYQISQ